MGQLMGQNMAEDLRLFQDIRRHIDTGTKQSEDAGRSKALRLKDRQGAVRDLCRYSPPLQTDRKDDITQNKLKAHTDHAANPNSFQNRFPGNGPFSRGFGPDLRLSFRQILYG